MMHHRTKILRAHSNSNEVCGHAPGTLVCVSTSAGGGFVASAERIEVWVRRETWPEVLFPRVEFPQHAPDMFEYQFYEEDGTFYVEEHRLKYGWVLPVTEAQKKGDD